MCVRNGDDTFVFNIEAGNYYSQSTYFVTRIKQEKLHIGYFIHLGVFKILFTSTWISKDFKFRVSSSRNNQKRTVLWFGKKGQSRHNL